MRSSKVTVCVCMDNIKREELLVALARTSHTVDVRFVIDARSELLCYSIACCSNNFRMPNRYCLIELRAKP